MTVQDLLTQAANNAGDSSGDFTNDARRWLNLTRSYIASECLWKRAMRDPVTITTSAATTNGIYTLRESGTDYDFVAGDLLFDESNDRVIRHESLGTLRSADMDRSTTGSPDWWGDAGDDGNGLRQIYLWPVPDGTYTITFPAYLLLTDLSASNDGLSEDPFFGPISPWAACFASGMRFFYDQDNNESDTALELSERRFRRLIKRRMAYNTISPNSSLKSRAIRTQRYEPQMGRLGGSYPYWS